MTHRRRVKYLVIVGLIAIAYWQSKVDETAIGLTPEHLRLLVAPVIIFMFVAGSAVFFVLYVLPYAAMAFGGAAVLIWIFKRKWSAPMVGAVVVGAIAAFLVLAGVDRAALYLIAATALIIVVSRCIGRPFHEWIDGFRLWQVVLLTLLTIWVWSSINWQSLVPTRMQPTVEQQDNEYRTRYAHEMDERTRRAIARFPDAQSCLQAGRDASVPGDLYAMNWDRIDTKAEAQVCIFRLLSALPGIGASRVFLEAQGFRMSDQGFNPENPYVEPSDGALRVAASWSLSENGPKYPMKGILGRWLASVPYGMSVDIYYDPTGEDVLAVQIFFNTL